MRAGLVVVACGLLGLAGCSGAVVSGDQAGGSQTQVVGAKLTGAVHGGQNPIAGAHVYLFAAASGAGGAGTAAYGGAGIAASTSNASVPLLTSGSGQDGNNNYYVTTGGDGGFSLSGDYTCTPGQQVYLYSVGGDPGLGTGANAAAGLMAALGSCPAGGNFMSGPAPVTSVMVNEVSTVAAAYAMAGFATDAVHVGSSGTALALSGIGNAFANAANLVDLPTGAALAVTPGGNGTAPRAQINTLANILAACVNSDGTGPACATLFANATADGTTMGTVAADTATAAIYIAHNPEANVAALYGLASGTPPFGGGLTAQPNDFTVELGFTGGPSSGVAVAIDGSGNVWIPDFDNNKVVELSSSGTVLSGSGYAITGINEPTSIAIDPSGNAWVSAHGSEVDELSESGTPVAGYNSTGGLWNGWAVAIDGSGDAWIANGNAHNVIELSGSGSVLSGSGLAGAGLFDPGALAIDGSGDAWVINYLGTSVAEFSGLGSNMSGVNGYAGGGLNNTRAIAVDGGGNAWIANAGGSASSLTKLSGSGAVLSGTMGYSGGGMNNPYSIAIDGGGNAWVANDSIDSGQPPFGSTTPGSVTEFSNVGAVLSGSAGYQIVGGSAIAIAVDGSGNVWMAGGNVVTEMIGAGAPVVTPLAVGVKNNMLGTRP